MAIFVNDTFSGQADADDLKNHTGETGATWTYNNGSTVGWNCTAAGRVYLSSGSSAIVASGTPASPDYEVKVMVEKVDATATSGFGLIGRWLVSTSAGTSDGYYTKYLSGSGLQLFRYNSNTPTQIGSNAVITLPTVSAIEYKLKMVGTAIEVWWNGVAVISVTDSTVTRVGAAGLRNSGSSALTATTGIQYTSFTATDIVGESSSSSTGSTSSTSTSSNTKSSLSTASSASSNTPSSLSTASSATSASTASTISSVSSNTNSSSTSSSISNDQSSSTSSKSTVSSGSTASTNSSSSSSTSSSKSLSTASSASSHTPSSDSSSKSSASSSNNSMTAVDMVSNRIYQRDQAARTFSLSGTWVGIQPTSVQARVIRTTDSVVLKDWTSLQAPLIGTGGTWSGNFVIQAGPDMMHLEWRTRNISGGVLSSVIGANSFGLGDVFAVFGSSTSVKWFTDGTTTPTVTVREYKSGSWQTLINNGNGAVAFANDYGVSTGVAVGFLDSGQTGSYLNDHTGVNTNSWTNTGWTGWTSLVSALSSGSNNYICGSIIHVGSNDAALTGAIVDLATFLTDYRTLISNVRTAVGNPSLPMFLIGGCRRTAGGLSDTQFNIERNGERILGSDSKVYLAAYDVDVETLDGIHPSPAAFLLVGNRVSRTAQFFKNVVSNYVGPQITSAQFNAARTTVDVRIAHSGGTDFTPTSGITGFAVSGATISSAVRNSATVIRLTLSSAASAGATLTYHYGVNPDITGVVVDNSALALPLRGAVDTGAFTIMDLESSSSSSNTASSLSLSSSSSSSGDFTYVKKSYTYPTLVIAPTRASAPSLVVFLHGAGEVGDGSWDGTFVESATNQLSYTLRHGPGQCIRGGVTFFTENNCVVACLQTTSSWSNANINTTINSLVTDYGINTARIHITGLSLGGGGAWQYALAFPSRAYSLAPIAGSSSPVAQITTLNNVKIWAVHDADDGTVPPLWDLASPSHPEDSSLDFANGWVSRIAYNTRPLDNHPDNPTVTAHSAAPTLHGVVGTYTGEFNWDGNQTWRWTAGAVVPRTNLAITLYPTGGHGGWDATYGTGTSDFNLAFWNWALGNPDSSSHSWSSDSSQSSSSSSRTLSSSSKTNSSSSSSNTQSTSSSSSRTPSSNSSSTSSSKSLSTSSTSKSLSSLSSNNGAGSSNSSSTSSKSLSTGSSASTNSSSSSSKSLSTGSSASSNTLSSVSSNTPSSASTASTASTGSTASTDTSSSSSKSLSSPSSASSGTSGSTASTDSSSSSTSSKSLSTNSSSSTSKSLSTGSSISSASSNTPSSVSSNTPSSASTGSTASTATSASSVSTNSSSSSSKSLSTGSSLSSGSSASTVSTNTSSSSSKSLSTGSSQSSQSVGSSQSTNTSSSSSNTQSSSTSTSKSISTGSSVSTGSSPSSQSTNSSSSSSNTPSSLSSHTPSSLSTDSSPSSVSTGSTATTATSITSQSSSSTSKSLSTGSSQSTQSTASTASTNSSSSSTSKSLSTGSSASTISSGSSQSSVLSLSTNSTNSSSSSSTSSSSSSSKSLSSLSSVSTASSPSSLSTDSSLSSNSSVSSLSTAQTPSSLSTDSTSTSSSSSSSSSKSSGSTDSSSSSTGSTGSTMSTDSTSSSSSKSSGSTASTATSLSTNSSSSSSSSKSLSSNSSSSESSTSTSSTSTASTSSTSGSSVSSKSLSSLSSQSTKLSSSSSSVSFSSFSTENETHSSQSEDSASSESSESSEESSSSSEYVNRYRYVQIGNGFSGVGAKVSYGGNFSIYKAGSVVQFNEETRFVYSVTFHYKPGYRKEMPAQRIVTHVNLGGSDTHVPVDQVKLLKF